MRYCRYEFRTVYRRARIPAKSWRLFFCSWTNGPCVFGASPAARLKFLRPRLRGQDSHTTSYNMTSRKLILTSLVVWSGMYPTQPFDKKGLDCLSTSMLRHHPRVILVGSDLGTYNNTVLSRDEKGSTEPKSSLHSPRGTPNPPVSMIMASRPCTQKRTWKEGRTWQTHVSHT